MDPASAATFGEVSGRMSVAFQDPLGRQQPVDSYRATCVNTCRRNADLQHEGEEDKGNKLLKSIIKITYKL